MDDRVFYALTDGVCSDPLPVGRTVIGRSVAPVEGVAFVNLESPRGAISRLQATIDVAPNGDAWLSDCSSTNGTFLATRPGLGVRLRPNHCYQLTAGCRIVFGDVERHLVAVDAAPSPTRTTSSSVATTAPAALQCESARERASGGAAVGSTSPLKNTAGSEVPYLASSDDGGATSHKRRRAVAAEDGPETSAGHRVRGVRVCVSGMDAEQRALARRAVRRHGGSLVEDVVGADILVTPAPATRTPKLIIAVGRGIPVVSEDCLQSDPLDRATQERCIVPVTHDRHSYTSTALRRVIFRDNRTPLLEGAVYNLARLPPRVRRVAEEVVVGCGGQVTRRKCDPGTVLDEESVTALYDAILRGDRPRATGTL